MKIQTCKNIFENEKRILGDDNDKTLLAMNKASLAVLEEVEKIVAYDKQAKIAIVASHTNNGGDGFALGHHLLKKGYENTDIFFIGKAEKFSFATRNFYEKIKDVVITMDPYSPPSFDSYTVIVDALLGFNQKGTLREEYIPTVREINISRGVVVSVDVATGIDAASGIVYSEAVHADVSITFSSLKACHFLADGREKSGNVLVKDIGFEIGDDEETLNLLTTKEASTLLMERKSNTHKYKYGYLSVVATNPLMPGAACLGIRGASVTGVGLIKAIASKNVLEIITKKLPDEILYSEIENASNLEDALGKSTCVLFGGGMTKESLNTALLEILLNQNIKLVVDAGGLFHLTQLKNRIKDKKASLIITPHTKEASMLLDCDISNVSQNPIGSLNTLKTEYNATVVLKSNVILIGEKEKNYILPYGTTALAKAGTGDVLAGITSGFFAGNYTAAQAALLASYTLQMASNKENINPYSVTASDIIHYAKDVLYSLYSIGRKE